MPAQAVEPAAATTAPHDAGAAEARPSETAPAKPKKAAPWLPHDRSPKFHDNRHAARGRLPDGATFTVRYLGAVSRWVGELTVDGERFEADAGGVFVLLHELDCRFRAARLEKPEAASADPAKDGAIC